MKNSLQWMKGLDRHGTACHMLFVNEVAQTWVYGSGKGPYNVYQRDGIGDTTTLTLAKAKEEAEKRWKV